MARPKKQAKDEIQALNLNWAEVVADWADLHARQVTLERDAMDGWFATIHFSDGAGSYSRTLDQSSKKSGETAGSYRERIKDDLRKAVEECYRDRVLALARRPMNIPAHAA